MATITYKCPNCDGGLLFDPATQRYHCGYGRFAGGRSGGQL